LNKLKKRKTELPKESEIIQTSEDRRNEVFSHRNAVEKLKQFKANLADKSLDI
jgi:hypothetical protein